MSVQTDQALSKAFELIEADKLDEAREILKPILDTEKDNPDVWWLYAHAVTDPETARIALNNVQRLDPNYLNTGDLLFALENRADKTDAAGDKEPSFLPPIPSTLPDLPGAKSNLDDDDDWDIADDDDDEENLPIYRRPLFLLAIGSLIIIVIAAVVILQPQPQSQGGIPTSTVTVTDSNIVAENPTLEVLVPTAILTTDEPTQEILEPSEIPPTDEQIATPETLSATDTPSVDIQVATSEVGAGFSDISTALAAFDIPDDGIALSQTGLGNTLVVKVCTAAGAQLRETLPEVIKAAAKQFTSFPEGVEGLVARMTDCETDSVLLQVGVSAEDTQAYANGSLSDEDFQAKWRPVN